MSCIHYHHDELYIEKVSLKTIAEDFGTPCYIYSRAKLEANWQSFDKAFSAIPHRICYAVKANSNIAILNLLAKLGSGFDIVSLGELERVIAASGDTKKIIFSGGGKKHVEIERAIRAGIHCFDVESESELERLNSIAQNLNKTVNIAFRINPNIAAGAHAHIATGAKENKFGIDINDVIPLVDHLSQFSCLKLIGIAAHIGSQILELKPFLLAIDSLLTIYKKLQEKDINLKHINIGGGLGITYHHEHPPAVKEYALALQEKIATSPLEIILEPGRAIVGNAGVLLTRIEYLKHTQHKNFIIVDAGMNDLIRPALYDAWQKVVPVTLRSSEKKQYDIAGPVCESADFMGKDRELAIEAGDLLAIDSAGAYGFSMSSNYNSRCRAAEILVDNTHTFLIRQRETIHDLFALEKIPHLEKIES
ncbi:MAG: diaminopimelate decarboxylase [Gammaproteobacteria bacterium]|nr:diaminopimelate decarboxylase [Gammaproteobacteria bacterium]